MRYKEQVKDIFRNINTKEELLLTFWKVKIVPETEKVFKEEFRRIEASLIEENNILDMIINIFSFRNDFYISIYSLCEQYNISISSVIYYLEEKSKKYSKDTNEYKVLTHIRNELLLGLKANKRLEEQELDYVIAKEVMTIFLNTDANTYLEFNKITKCREDILKISIEILREKNHPLYLEYLKRKQTYFNNQIQQLALNNRKDTDEKNIIMAEHFKHLTPYQLFNIIKNADSKEYDFLWKKYHIKPTILKTLIEINPSVAIRIALNPMTYFEYENCLNDLVSSTVLEIKDVINGKKAHFDLYNYYLKTRISLYKLYYISAFLGNSENKSIIENFYKRHKYSFSALTENHIRTIRSIGIISFNEQTVRFNRREFDRALEHIDNNNMPRCKALLFEIIKNKLYLKEDKVECNKAAFLEQASSLEELLMIKWITCGNEDSSYSYNSFYKKARELINKNAIDNFNEIINDLINGMNLNEIKKKYLITSLNFKEVIKQYLRERADSDILNISVSKKELSNSENEDIDFILASTTFNLLFKYNCFLATDIEEKLNCHGTELSKYLRIIETKNKDLYNEYQKAYRKEKSQKLSMRSALVCAQSKDNILSKLDNLSRDDILNIFNNPKSMEFSYFCQRYGLMPRTLSNLLKIDPLIKEELANNIDNIKNIYSVYVTKFGLLIEKVIKDIVDLEENGYKEPFDLYEYYSNTDVNINYLARMALDFDIRNNSIILEYINNHKDLFLGIDEKGTVGLRAVGRITCCNNSISFDNKQISEALNNMNEKKLPHIKGVLYYAIKRQLDKGKVKKNTLFSN